MSHQNQPHFYNQPHFQSSSQGNPDAQSSNIYMKVLIDENNLLKKELKEMTEMVGKLRKGVGSKKRQILNEIMNLVSTKNAFEERYVSEVSTCPYKSHVKYDSKISNSVLN
jgi:hypothetical protein